MADIKTHLRELSVALGIYYAFNNINLNEINNFTPAEFLTTCKNIISNDISIANNILELSNFTSDHLSIINNSFRLGYAIVNNNLVSNINHITWVGGNTQKENPIDLFINDIGFSLKENSFILENMGLYKFINLLTGSNFKMGLHIFNDFAPTEYNNWFNFTWNTMRKSNLPWELITPNYTSKIEVSSHSINLILNNQILSSIPNKEITISEFMNYTNSKSREKIFSKWINKNLSLNETYLQLKNECSNKAGIELCNYIHSKLNPTNFSRFLQIYDKSYYYAKSTTNELSVFKVPSIDNFDKTIQIMDISYSVPESQLNILTEIKNTKNNQSLKFRNECRFSHGQFNGTPEAKMYYELGNDLSAIYEKII